MSSTEFHGIFQVRSGTSRPVMSRPPAPVATKAFIDEVRATLGIEGAAAVEAADWILGKMERFAAFHAEPVFTMEGAGPVCSYCGTIWPLCGHHHYSDLASDGAGAA